MTVAKWRPALYFFRFAFLITNLILCASHYRPVQIYLQHRQLTSYTAVLVVLACGCVNDLYMLTWDIFTYGSFLAHAISQISISLALVSILTLETVWMLNMWHISVSQDPTIISKLALTRGLLSVAASLLSSVAIMVVTAVFWIQSSSRPLGHGIKDVRWTIFGMKRSANDEVRSSVRKVWKTINKLPHWLKNSIVRRVIDIEDKRHAVARNVAAVILLSLLVARSVDLFHGVIYEKFDTREVWRVPWPHSPDFCHFTLIHEIDATQTWSLFSTLSSSAANVTSIVPSTPATCEDSSKDGISICQPINNTCKTAQADILDFAMIANIPDHNSSIPERIWVAYNKYPVEELVRDSTIARLYDHGIHFMPGFQLSGLVTLTERRRIESHFSDMLGLEPTYCSYVIPSIDWMQSTPLNNESIAWVTLRFNTPERYFGQGEKFMRVIEDFRQHTFISALSSIGGLLTVFQGLHILCFGKPLFWGMFGSKLLNPFGIFTFGTRTLRKRMAARYGFDMESRTFSAEGLSLFLRDFVLDIGPLNKDDDDDDGDGEGDGHVENGNRGHSTIMGETQAYNAIPLEGVEDDLEDDSRSIHVNV